MCKKNKIQIKNTKTKLVASCFLQLNQYLHLLNFLDTVFPKNNRLLSLEIVPNTPYYKFTLEAEGITATSLFKTLNSLGLKKQRLPKLRIKFET